MKRPERAKEPPKKIGFTLIELLIVVGVIAILTGLILTALGNARAKASDARIKSNIQQYRKLSELHYNANSTSYLNFNTCITSPSTTNCKGGILNDIIALNADMVILGTTLTRNATAAAMCVSAPLLNTADHACNDSTGKFTEAVTGCGANTFCP